MDYNSLLLFFKQYNEHYRDFLAFELKKMKLVAEDDIQGLTDSIKTEQALIMKTNAFETKRLRILSGANGQNKTFSTIIDEAPDDKKDALRAEFKELSRLVLEIKKVNDNVRLIVAERMKRFETPSESDTYNVNGGKNHSDENVHSMMKSV